ncbi:hypothetical protein C2S51_025740 [Perilla frutescens var. frutescens]|nr:hypothetical protein C2S51_025740 [Perilla frutescens var. frutescens]
MVEIQAPLLQCRILLPRRALFSDNAVGKSFNELRSDKLSEVAKVVETQGTLERQLELIETHQDEEEFAIVYSSIGLGIVVCKKSSVVYCVSECVSGKFQVDKALQSMEEEAERLYREERGMLLDELTAE